MDEEEEIIKNYIKELQDELQVSFKERKQQMGVSENIEDELTHLFDEIQNKEDQLKQVLDLTNIMMNKKSELEETKSREIDNLEQTLFSIETESEITKQTSNQYQRLYQESLEKNSELQNVIQNLEDQMTSQNSQQMMMKKELMNLKQKEVEQMSNQDQKQLIMQLEKELKGAEEQNKQYQNELKELRGQQKEMLQNYKISFEGFEKLQYENKNIRENLKNLERKVSEKQQECDQYKNFIEFQKDEIKDYQNKQKALESTLQIVEQDLKRASEGGNANPSAFGQTISQFKGGRGASYFSTFDEPEMRANSEFQQEEIHGSLEDTIKKNFFEDDQKKNKKKVSVDQDKNPLTLQENNNNGSPNKNNAEAEKRKQKQKEKSEQLKNIISNSKQPKAPGQKTEKKYKVPPPIKRDPYEEFFELVIQAVKLNSPYMDDILGINTKGWYKLAQGELVPFHKWYQWVDKKLHGIRDELIKSREKSLLYSKRVIVF